MVENPMVLVTTWVVVTEMVETIVLVLDPAAGPGTAVVMTDSTPSTVVVIVVTASTGSVAGTTE